MRSLSEASLPRNPSEATRHLFYVLLEGSQWAAEYPIAGVSGMLHPRASIHGLRPTSGPCGTVVSAHAAYGGHVDRAFGWRSERTAVAQYPARSCFVYFPNRRSSIPALLGSVLSRRSPISAPYPCGVRCLSSLTVSQLPSCRHACLRPCTMLVLAIRI